MPDINVLIQHFGKQGHPLGHSIREEEAPTLVDNLRQRLGASEKDLDLSSASLRRLERRLHLFYRGLEDENRLLTDEEHLILIREIAAYLGKVLVLHAGGQWRSLTTLWGTEVVFERPVAVLKGREIHAHTRTVYSLGNLAASAWSCVNQGLKPNLYGNFRDALAPRVYERLGKAKPKRLPPKLE